MGLKNKNFNNKFQLLLQLVICEIMINFSSLLSFIFIMSLLSIILMMKINKIYCFFFFKVYFIFLLYLKKINYGDSDDLL